MEYDLAEIGSGTTKTMASIALDLKDTYCHFTLLRQSGKGGDPLAIESIRIQTWDLTVPLRVAWPLRAERLKIAEQGAATDCLERPLLRRSRFRQRLSATVCTSRNDMGDIFRRLQIALPQVLIWVDQLLEQNARSATGLDLAGFARLPLYWPAEVLQGVRIVVGRKVPFPPMAEYGLPEFAEMEKMPMAGITFRNMFFIDKAYASEAVAFHELVHTVQWNALGPSDFLFTYGVGLAQFGYESSPLEAVAYELQTMFEREESIPSISTLIANHAFQTRKTAVATLAQYGIRMSA